MAGGKDSRYLRRSLAGLTLMILIYVSILFPISRVITPVSGEASIKPSKNWGMFFNTVGDIRVNITDPGVAVRIDVPREFVEGREENDTSYIFSDISSDYYYYKTVDQSLHYPYNENAPYSIEIWNPPRYFYPACVGIYHNFTPPKFVLLEELEAPDIAGVYNFSVFIAKNMTVDGWGRLLPNFPDTPSIVLEVPVSMREDPGHIYGTIWDYDLSIPITTKGVVYAIEQTTGVKGRAYVNATTGFFNITGLYEGAYRLEGSAGCFPTTGFAYAPTIYSNVIVNRGGAADVGNFALDRGAIINGTIEYVDEFNSPIRPLDSPYLKQLGIGALNYTVEAYDIYGRIVASQTYSSQNTPQESYTLFLRNGSKHIGYPALGSEYSGFGEGRYTIRVWVYGFLQPQIIMVNVPSYIGEEGVDVTASTIQLPYGGLVSGKIDLYNGLTNQLETPREGEFENLGTRSGTRFGGNILVELYDEHGVLRGLTLFNRTMANGTCTFADYSSGDDTDQLRFHILGFSDFFNYTYRGVWRIGSNPGPSPWDYGLKADRYYIKVWIRGYMLEDANPSSIVLSRKGSAVGFANVTLSMVRGGGVDVMIASMTTRPGTRTPQALINWTFFYMCPPPYIRIYVYNGAGVSLGYAETQLRIGAPGVTNEYVRLNFTGQNWPLYKILFYGYLPSWMDEGDHSVKGYTYGYVQTRDVEFYVPISTVVSTGFAIQQGSNIYGAASLMSDSRVVSLTENATVEMQALLGGVLKGANITNTRAGSSSSRFSTWGFYGRGHFFYVDRYGDRWFDYGLDTGGYTVFIPEFRRTGSGVESIFFQEVDVYASLPELGYRRGVYYPLERMIKIYGNVLGETGVGPPFTVPLVWVEVSTDARVGYSYDGDYYLHIPPPPPGESELVTVTYTIPGYDVYTWSTSVTRGVDAVPHNPLLSQSGEPFP